MDTVWSSINYLHTLNAVVVVLISTINKHDPLHTRSDVATRGVTIPLSYEYESGSGIVKSQKICFRIQGRNHNTPKSVTIPFFSGSESGSVIAKKLKIRLQIRIHTQNHNTSTVWGGRLRKRFCNMFSGSSPCLLGKLGSMAAAVQPNCL